MGCIVIYFLVLYHIEVLKANSSEEGLFVEIILHDAGQLGVCLAKLQLLAFKWYVRFAAVEEDLAFVNFVIIDGSIREV